MQLYKQRIGQTDLAARTADGESLWVKVINASTRTRIQRAFERRLVGTLALEEAYRQVRRLILTAEGLDHLMPWKGTPQEEISGYLENGDHGDVLNVVEAMAIVLAWMQVAADGSFESAVNDAFQEQHASYELLGLQIVDRESQELHAAVLAPALRLLASRTEWAEVEMSYQDALREIAEGNADDAITDVARALQQALSLLGCTGNALGPLIESGRRKGLFSSHDTKLLEWVSADRSALGNARGSAHRSQDDAWLTVHVVGALILRLTGAQRG